MTWVPYVAATVLLLAVLLWALRGPAPRPKNAKDESALLEQLGQRPATYLPLIRQALSPADAAFIASRGFPGLMRRVRKERRGVALSYLAALHEDFTRLLHVATVVATLSPEVETAQEAERVWLRMQFGWRYRTLRAAMYLGIFPQRRLEALSHQVSELAVRLETAIGELGERAAIAAKLASSLDGRGMDVH